MRTIGIWCEHNFQIYSALPVINKYLENNSIIVFTNKGSYFDAVCLLQVTNPFRSLDLLNMAVNKFIKSDSDSFITVREIPHEYNPFWAFKKVGDNKLELIINSNDIIKKRQDLPKAYHRDGSIYITKTSVILNNNSLYGEKINFLVNKQKNHINIDTMNDWGKAEKLFNK